MDVSSLDQAADFPSADFPGCEIQQVQLRNHTTLQLGGRATLITPHSVPAAIGCLQKLTQRQQPYRILGNGSNLLVTEVDLCEPVISLKRLTGLQVYGRWMDVEAGFLLPRLVHTAARLGLGGLEYLVSVPGTVGGGICMNAGRGRAFQLCLHQAVESVTCFDGQRVRVLTAQELKTDYRDSIFRHEPHFCILSAVLKWERFPLETIRNRIRKRLEYTRRHQDHSAPNAGSLFRVGRDFEALKGQSCGRAAFSEKTPNWILNRGATFAEIRQLITSAGPEEDLEWVIWE